MKRASISALCSSSSIVLPRRLLPMIAPATKQPSPLWAMPRSATCASSKASNRRYGRAKPPTPRADDARQHARAWRPPT
jgi:hypothetical protein